MVAPGRINIKVVELVVMVELVVAAEAVVIRLVHLPLAMSMRQ